MPARRSLVTIVPAVAVIACAVLPTAAKAQQALMINSSWAGWMNQGQIAETPLPTGGMGAQLSVQTNYMAPSLVDFLTLSVAGKITAAKVAYMTVSSNLHPASQFNISQTRLAELDLPPADATSAAPAVVGLKFAQAPFETATPATGPTGNSLAQVLHSNAFQVKLDSMDAGSAMMVGAMVVRLPDVLKGANLPQFVLTYRTSGTSIAQAFAAGVTRWATSGATQNGSLTFFASDFKTPLLVVRYRGLRVISNVINSSTGSAVATFTMTGIAVQGGVTP